MNSRNDEPIEIQPVAGLGLVRAGDDLVSKIIEALAAVGRCFSDGDVLVLTSKIVSKAEDRVVELNAVVPGHAARALARVSGRDARLCELIIANTRKVWGLIPSGPKGVEWATRLPEVFPIGADATAEMFAREPTMILAELPSGLCLADAGIDSSNVEGVDRVILLPLDPNESCRRFAAQILEQTGTEVAVVISDTELRVHRFGSIDHAIGSWGIQTVAGHFGTLDFVGRPKHGGMEATTDAIVAAASLVMGNCAEGIPAAVVRGARFVRKNAGMLPIQEPPSTYLKGVLFNLWCRVRLAYYRLIGTAACS